VDEAGHAIAATALAADPALLEQPLGAASNDARHVERGGLFVALAGTKAHGMAFVDQAIECGAHAVLAGSDAPREDIERASQSIPVLVADDDSLTALGRLAAAWRTRMDFAVVGITGSAGKTSTKDMLGSLLQYSKVVIASPENHNNEIGLPLTLLSADARTEIVVCEMGMRGLEQIEYLCGIARPNVGVVTNAGPAHVELLGSVENVVKAKAELISGVGADGTAVVPAMQPELLEAAVTTPGTVLRFGSLEHGQGDAVVTGLQRVARGISGTIDFLGRSIPFELPVHGAHNATNLAAAICAYAALGADLDRLADALTEIRITSGRGDRHPLPGGGVIIDDTYNANPLSMRAALEELSTIPAHRHVAVLGRMAELGDESERWHRDLGVLASQSSLDLLVVVGTDTDATAIAEAATCPVMRVPNVESAAASMDEWHQSGDALLVKASNSVGLAALAEHVRSVAPHVQEGASA
jgi:UDP-N-acetylmuramoyl-tripeptide--D-alanyl-D-alanine ligase